MRSSTRNTIAILPVRLRTTSDARFHTIKAPSEAEWDTVRIMD